MNLLSKMYDKTCSKQWAIGVAKAPLKEVLVNGINALSFNWLMPEKKSDFWADPFFVTSTDGHTDLIFEDINQRTYYGKIRHLRLNEQGQPVSSTVLLDTGRHLSYPFIFNHPDGQYWLMPESAVNNEWLAYPLSLNPVSLGDPIVLMAGTPLLDATLFYYEGLYWVFATHRGPNSNTELHLYYASKPEGPYTPHRQNPVKSTLFGSRPAGKFFQVDGDWYRPAMDCREYYGKAIVIQKLKMLNPDRYEEETIQVLTPPSNSPFSFGMHTFNVHDGLIVIDGLRRWFDPIGQIIHWIYRKKQKKRLNS
jgi:hypothetical protein